MDQGEDPECSTSIATIDRFAIAALTSNHVGFPVDADGYPLPSRLSEDSPECAHYQKKLDGVIVDNDLRERLVNQLPAGSQLVVRPALRIYAASPLMHKSKGILRNLSQRNATRSSLQTMEEATGSSMYASSEIIPGYPLISM